MKSFKQYIKEQGPPMEKPWFPGYFPFKLVPKIPADDDDDELLPFDEPDWQDEYDPDDQDGDGIPNDQDDDYVEPEPIDWDDIYPWMVPDDPNQGTPFQNPDGTWTV